jgi:hypothetical protein
MITCKVYTKGDFYADASLAAPPHVGEYVWFANGEGTRDYYKIETVVHSSSGEVEIISTAAARPPFHLG